MLRHNVNTVGWKPSSFNGRPAATFQAMFIRNWPIASRSDNPSNACSTITVAITSAGTDGRPRSEANRSANMLVGEQTLTMLGEESVHRVAWTR